MTRDGVGVFVILAGIIVIIGAAKGTWKQLWYDVTGQSIQTNPITSANNPGAQAPGFGTLIGAGAGLVPGVGGILGPAISGGQAAGVIPRGYTPGTGGLISLEPIILPYAPGEGQSGQGVVTTQ